MPRRHFVAFLLAAFLLPILRPAMAQEKAQTGPLRVLFIGNSYTSVNNLPAMVQALAAAAKEKRPLEFVMQTPGGWAFQRHIEDEKGEAAKKIASEKWDFVVLQEQSQMPFMYPKVTMDNGTKLGKLVKEAGSTPLLYLTWARENQPENQAAITKTYTDLAAALEAPIAPVGIAWEAARKARGNLVLYNKDQSHPSPAGTYLAACVFYSTIYGKSPENLPGKLMISSKGKSQLLVEITKADAAFFQKTAWETVQGMKKKSE